MLKYIQAKSLQNSLKYLKIFQKINQSIQLNNKQNRVFSTQEEEQKNNKKPIEINFKENEDIDKFYSKLRINNEQVVGEQIKEEKVKEPIYMMPSLIIYENTYDFKKVAEKLNRFYVGLGCWFGIGSITYIYIHPLLAAVPTWFFCGTLMNLLLMKRYFTKKLVTKIELTDDMQHIKFTRPFNSNEKEIVCYLDNVELIEVKELDQKITKNQQFKSIMCSVNLLDINNVFFKDIKIIVESSNTIIHNLDLFRAAINGEQKLILKFKLVSPEEYNDIVSAQNDDQQ